MKKLSTLFILTGALLVFASCGTKTSTSANYPSNSMSSDAHVVYSGSTGGGGSDCKT